MDKQEFLKQMISFGEELLAQEQKPKLNDKAIVEHSPEEQSVGTRQEACQQAQSLITS